MGRKKEIPSLEGRVFGRLTALKEWCDGRRYRYICLCECGNTISVLNSSLWRGKTKSCGCLRKKKKPEKVILSTQELAHARSTIAHRGVSYPRRPSFVCRKIGKLYVTNEYTLDGKRWCECSCECGNRAKVLKNNLASGRTRSCGCGRGKRSKKPEESWKLFS